jgi:hypothetical protein
LAPIGKTMDKVIEKVTDEENKKKFLKGVNGAAKLFS